MENTTLYIYIKTQAILAGVPMGKLAKIAGYKHPGTLTRSLQSGSVKKKNLVNIIEFLNLEYEPVLSLRYNESE